MSDKAQGSEVFLVGFQLDWSVDDPDYPMHRGMLEFWLHQKLPKGVTMYDPPDGPKESIETSWWIAEDDRSDRSDCDSAVFVPNGMTQAEAKAVLENHMMYKEFLAKKAAKADESGD